MLFFEVSEWDRCFWGDEGYGEFMYLYWLVIDRWFVGIGFGWMIMVWVEMGVFCLGKMKIWFDCVFENKVF